ncbi:hypothetical protein [Bremerella cremea]|uniref:hypothetical protein n=1 Tax=Bremerella cremea TaxID=1031537 RepID=UPI0031F1B6E4
MESPQQPSGSINPFASPSVAGEMVNVVPDGYQVEGNRIVGGEKIVLPEICAKCCDKGHETLNSKRRKKDLYWIHPAVYILLFFQIIIFLIVYLILRKKCQLEYSLCRSCSSRVRLNWLFFTISLAIAMSGIVIAIVMETPWPIVIFFLGLFAMIYFAVCANGPLLVATYSNNKFYLRGGSPEYLAAIDVHVDATSPVSAILAEDGRMG